MTGSTWSEAMLKIRAVGQIRALRACLLMAGALNGLARPAWLSRPVLITAPVCLLLAPFLPLIHQTLVLSIAMGLRAIASSHIFKNALVEVGFDPVYASVLNRTLGNIDARGLAVADPAGSLLHQVAPEVFAAPDKVAPGAWATALVGDGVSLLSSVIATIGTETVFIVAGLVMLWIGLRSGQAASRARYTILLLVGLILQVRGIGGLLTLRFSIEDMEIMGVSHLFTKLFPMDSGSYGQIVTDPLATTATGLMPFLPILAIYGPVLLVVLRRRKPAWRQLFRSLPLQMPNLGGPLRLDPSKMAPAMTFATALVIGGLVSQGLFPALADYNYSVENQDAPALTEDPLLAQPGPPEPTPAPKEIARPGPSKVLITGGNYQYGYTVNGQPQKLRGVGYNPSYSQLSLWEREAQFDRDFGQMKATGVNTILGWDKEQFDGLMLLKAQQYGIGVIIPYDLPIDGNYGNPAYEQSLGQDVKDWVKEFQGYPALRMWGVGNEVIHGMGKNPNTPRAKAFAEFYVRLVDTVHAMDPDHPVTYRDAEDLYLGPIRAALKKDAVPRPWFVYGVNLFTPRICQVLADWPKREMDVPVMVSEFAPSGLSPNDRPKGYLDMLKCIAQPNPSVLGGFAYVWFTSGPEAIDRVMGLVDGEGRPADRSLHVLGKAFRHEGDGPEGGAPGR